MLNKIKKFYNNMSMIPVYGIHCTFLIHFFTAQPGMINWINIVQLM